MRLHKLRGDRSRIAHCDFGGIWRSESGDNMKRNSQFSATHKDKSMAELVRNADPKTLAVWANDCVKRVMPYYEGRYPEDHRPRRALEALQAWINTGVFRMEVIRKTALTSHAAARDVGEDNAARSAARAAGQAVATAQVSAHSVAAANMPCRLFIGLPTSWAPMPPSPKNAIGNSLIFENF